VSIDVRMTSAGIGVVAAVVLMSAAPVAAWADDGGGPSVLTLTMGDGDSLDSATNQRTVLLTCSCQFIYKPVTVAAEGIWHGVPVSYRHTFPNKCMEQNSNKYVFAI
jgi:hypothetical protein